MVAIETINYTFFIVGEFSMRYVTIFGGQAVVGILSTHLLKKILGRFSIFARPTSTIWIVALGSTFLLSSILFVVSTIPTLISNYQEVIAGISFIVVFGTIINWMRYVGVWVIIYFMYQLLARNQAIEREKLESQNIANLSQLELLRTQLNPHFLFNALNSIKALVTIDPEKSKDAIIKLSELLRFTLNYGLQPLIPLNEEILEVKKYLALEQIRFGERLHVEYEISESSLTRMIPPAIILTLSENAIKHGIAQEISGGKILVQTSTTGNQLIIQMSNPGTLVQKASTGIGLRNATMRLKTLFGDNAEFSMIESTGRVLVTIKIKTE
ncbi:histidine kinase [soil metagenome]